MRDESTGDDLELCDVIYRADRMDRTEVTLRLHLPTGTVTASDGWKRLTAAHGPIDPRSIEIEIRALAVA